MVLLWLAAWVTSGLLKAVFGVETDGFAHISFNHPDAWSISLALTAYLSLFQK